MLCGVGFPITHCFWNRCKLATNIVNQLHCRQRFSCIRAAVFTQNTHSWTWPHIRFDALDYFRQNPNNIDTVFYQFMPFRCLFPTFRHHFDAKLPQNLPRLHFVYGACSKNAITLKTRQSTTYKTLLQCQPVRCPSDWTLAAHLPNHDLPLSSPTGHGHRSNIESASALRQMVC